MLVACFFSLALAALASAQTLQQVLSQNTQTLSTLNSLLQANPQLTQTLTNARGITILAPNNQAFDKFLAENPSAAQMARDPTLVTALLSYHVLAGTFTAKSFSTTPQFAPTLLSQAPFANVTGGQKVELALVPARGSNTGNAAVISGFRRQSIVAATDIPFSGGIIHVIDTVLTVPLKPSQVALDSGLTSLAGAVTQANLVGTLDSTRDITVFAPSNQAFQAIGSAVGQLNAQQLGAILAYHVVSGSVLFSTALSSNGQPMSIRTLNGQVITVRRQGGEVFVNSARVVTPDVITGNGVVHVIDGVLNPSATALTPNPSQTTQSVAFNGASGVANEPFTGAVTPTTTVDTLGATGAAQPGAIPGSGLLALLGGAALLANI